MTKAEWAVHILKTYSKETGLLPRSTMDLSPLEQWLIIHFTPKKDSYSKSYNELIMAVESKYPNESRHQTALRYIKDREANVSHSCSKDLPVTTK